MASGAQQLARKPETGSPAIFLAASAMVSPLRNLPEPSSARVQETHTGLPNSQAAVAAASASSPLDMVSHRNRSL